MKNSTKNIGRCKLIKKKKIVKILEINPKID